MTREEAEALAREICDEIAQSSILRSIVEYSHVDECSRVITPETMGEPPTWCVRLVGLDDNRFPLIISNRTQWEADKAAVLERWPQGITR